MCHTWHSYLIQLSLFSKKYVFLLIVKIHKFFYHSSIDLSTKHEKRFSLVTFQCSCLASGFNTSMIMNFAINRLLERKWIINSWPHFYPVCFKRYHQWYYFSINHCLLKNSNLSKVKLGQSMHAPKKCVDVFFLN